MHLSFQLLGRTFGFDQTRLPIFAASFVRSAPEQFGELLANESYGFAKLGRRSLANPRRGEFSTEAIVQMF